MASTGDVTLALKDLEGRLLTKLTDVQESLRAELDGLRRDMDGHFDAVYQRFDRLETEYHMLVAGLRRVEEAILESKEDRDRLRAEVADLRARVAELDERLKELETRLAPSRDGS